MPGKFLAEFELYVMMAVARLGDTAYGATVRREIEERTGRPVSIGALYATLARLGDKTYLDFDEVEPQPGERGRARKYCRLTSEGREAMDHSMSMMRRMMDGLEPAETTKRES